MIKLAFKYANPADIFEAFVAWKTSSPFCHVEAFIEGAGWFSAREGSGVGFIAALDASRKWRIAGMPYTLTPEAIAWANSMVGAGYDWLSLADFILHDGLISADKEICSRAVKDLLSRCHWDGDGQPPTFPANPSPGDLARVFLPDEKDVSFAAPPTFSLNKVEAFARQAMANRKVSAFGLPDFDPTLQAVQDAMSKLGAAADVAKTALGPLATISAAIDADKLVAWWKSEVAAGTIKFPFFKG